MIANIYVKIAQLELIKILKDKIAVSIVWLENLMAISAPLAKLLANYVNLVIFLKKERVFVYNVIMVNIKVILVKDPALNVLQENIQMNLAQQNVKSVYLVNLILMKNLLMKIHAIYVFPVNFL